MWRGNVSFGDYWTGYVGGTDQNSMHAHIATQLAIGIGGNVSIHWAGGVLHSAGVLIAPRIGHIAQADLGYVAFLYLAPQSSLSRALLRHAGGAAVIALDAVLVECVAGAPDLHQAVARLSAQLVAAPAPVDPRIDTALSALKTDRAGPGAIARAAVAAGLSEQRLRALAQASLGVPLSQWLLWRKLELAAMAIAAGAPLAAAAAEGGFADQAHLARTMRRLFGVTTSDVADSLQGRKRFVQDGW